MGLYYDFFIQQRDDAEWIVPVGFRNCLDGFREELGHFVWFKEAPVFVGDSALFELDTTPPADISQTVLYQQLGDAFDEWFYGWIGFESIMLDDWRDSYVFVPADVPLSLAHAFEDGAQPFPDDKLRQRGCTADEVASFRDDSRRVMLARPIAAGSSQRGFRGWVRVTWRMCIEDFIGNWRAREFQNLRRLGKDRDLRIICTRS